MLLQGSLPEFTIVDVLHLLSSSGKTGVIRFSRGRGGITQAGALYFRDGRAVAAETDGQAGRDALDLLCSWDAGSFVYHDGATSPRENLGEPPAQQVEKTAAVQEEWRDIWKVLHDASAVVRLANDLPAGVEKVQIERGEWKLLSGLSGPQVLSVLAQRAGGGLPAYRMLRKLAENGLLSVEPAGRG